MPIPNFPDKHKSRPIITPQQHVAYFRQQGFIPDFPIPKSVIFCYEGNLLERIANVENVEQVHGIGGEFYLLTETGNRVAVSGNNGIGAPGVSMVLEILIELGVKRFINVGIAGGLQKTSRVGDVVVCTSAIRDEGVSYHYLKDPSAPALPSKNLTPALRQTLERDGVRYTEGPTWTTDAFFRETVGEIQHYQQEGVITVEMEAAALFAISTLRGVEMASGFVISDLVADLVWHPQILAQETHDSLFRLYQAARATLNETNKN
ncbi:MAG: nucleoside phosphorylase [Candidatus Poribacteria bacterium]|nr:nucleoside phosphorylase [Candidatus Poribacteria bacterium]